MLSARNRFGAIVRTSSRGGSDQPGMFTPPAQRLLHNKVDEQDRIHRTSALCPEVSLPQSRSYLAGPHCFDAYFAFRGGHTQSLPKETQEDP
jgi:hypothetical protein